MQLVLTKLPVTAHTAADSTRAGPAARSRHVVRAQQQQQQPDEQNSLQAHEGSSPELFFPCSASFPPVLANDWRSFRARLVALEQGRAEQAAAMHQRHDVQWAHTIAQPERGCLLVARKPALGMFTHSVVLVLEHDDTMGTTGLVINMPTPLVISHLGLEDDLSRAFGRSPLFIGGPLGKERLHLLHSRREVEGSMEVMDGVYIGGLEHATEMVLRREARASDFNMLVGYSQWGAWQLAGECRDGTWWVLASSQGVIQDCLTEVNKWNPNTPTPMLSSEAVKKSCWERVLRTAGVDTQAAL